MIPNFCNYRYKNRISESRKRSNKTLLCIQSTILPFSTKQCKKIKQLAHSTFRHERTCHFAARTYSSIIFAP
ncbi:hypothetical protein [Paenibacillus sp. NPDC093718]|uniref:hypothetical protein n=1 Tax=Paenibacillus sp. NPDC093718 TaxID=3390601 RepID=UPI003CFDC992